MFPPLSPSLMLLSTTLSVDKATSELLRSADWTLNMRICDAINSDHRWTKGIAKALRKRLQHQSPRVQLLALTLLETMVKNCGEHIHYHILQKKILDEMMILAKRRAEMQVRDKALVLLDSWQEEFGGPGTKYAQYYWACDELRSSGVKFPSRSLDVAPIPTPPITNTSTREAQLRIGMPINSSTRLDEAMATEVEELSLSSIKSMRNVMELLTEMLQTLTPEDRTADKDELIVDLVERGRANQKKLMQMLTTAVDEDLLAQGIELNDGLQGVLAKYEAVVSGIPLLVKGTNLKSQLNPLPERSSTPDGEAYLSKTEGKKQAVEASLAAGAGMLISQVDGEEEQDEFVQLEQRHSEAPPVPSDAFIRISRDSASSSNGVHAALTESSDASANNALVLIDPPASVRTSKEQDMIDLLSIVLCTSTTSPEASRTPESAPPLHQIPVSPGRDSQTSQDSFSLNPFQASSSSYVVPWAQPQNQQQMQSYAHHPPAQQPAYTAYSSPYSPPPWAVSPGYGSNQSLESRNHYAFQQPGTFQNQLPSQATVNASSFSRGGQPLQHFNSFQNPLFVNNQDHPTLDSMNLGTMGTQGAKTLQHIYSFPRRGSNAVAMNGDIRITTMSPLNTPVGQKPFVPPYRLFEDLNVFGNMEGKLKSGTYPSASGIRSQSMVGGRK
ncbi:hypothetical protein Drorol1_Dr00013782 [Drosera rotundifolia]